MRIIKEIARGGFGRVEEVELNDGTVVARKVFDPSDAVRASTSLEKLKSRFKREVRVQSTLLPNYSIPILDYDLENDEMWYTMPLCERNFQTQIEEDKAKGTIPKEALADIINALEELHSLGLTHRDLNPRNILFHEGRWKLADFGLVSPPLDSNSDVSTTLAGWGTFTHMAPEQSTDFKHVDSRADIYAFGCIVHDIFTDGQRVPYGRQSCDGPIGMIVERCTEIDRERRFKSITAMRGALFTVLAEPLQLKPSIEASEWAGHLNSSQTWDEERLRGFTRFVTKLDDATDLWNVFIALEEDTLEQIYTLNFGYAESISIEYCEWIIEAAFDFAFCDVLVQRLLKIHELGNTDVKAKAILAIAKLGKSHNRFYVMRQLLQICGPEMEFSLAKRIAFEIQAEDAFWNFIDSSSGLNLTTDAFHPLIASVLEERIGRYR